MVRARAELARPAEAERPPFQVRGSVHTLVTLRLLEPDHPELLARLVEKIAYAPDFYRDAPVVLDVAPVAARPPMDLEAFCRQLREHRLVPVGIQNASPPWMEAARRAGLARFGEGGHGAAPSPRPRPAPAARGAAHTVTEPVRGGQQIVATAGDLVVMAPVGHGAEVAAVGHVHVYGPLRGRAFAGIEGDEGAMICCDRLHAELLSIAGVYMVAEEMDPALLGRPVVVRRRGERLLVEPRE